MKTTSLFHSWTYITSAALAASLVVAPRAQDADRAAAHDPVATAHARGVAFLVGQAEDDGTFHQRGEPHLGVTGLALAAVLSKPAEARTDAEKTFADKASKFLIAHQNDNGSFGESLTNYQTSAVVSALSSLDSEDAKAALARAQKYLLMAQNTEDHGFESSEQSYGSFGYGPGDRGDMSNTQLAIEALHASGLSKENDAYSKAIRFLQRTQNLKSVNDFESEVSEGDKTFPVRPGNDGGAAYYPGNSKFGFDVLNDGVRVPRSYGSMTYALLKTYALCGLDADDERMEAAMKWIRRNFTVDTNPGVHEGLDENAPYQGLYYYYQTMARALTVCGVDKVTPEGEDGKQKEVAWRTALGRKLVSEQRDDGSWLNEENGRWWEDQPVMCTIYATLALADCVPREK